MVLAVGEDGQVSSSPLSPPQVSPAFSKKRPMHSGFTYSEAAPKLHEAAMPVVWGKQRTPLSGPGWSKTARVMLCNVPLHHSHCGTIRLQLQGANRTTGALTRCIQHAETCSTQTRRDQCLLFLVSCPTSSQAQTLLFCFYLFYISLLHVERHCVALKHSRLKHHWLTTSCYYPHRLLLRQHSDHYQQLQQLFDRQYQRSIRPDHHRRIRRYHHALL